MLIIENFFTWRLFFVAIKTFLDKVRRRETHFVGDRMTIRKQRPTRRTIPRGSETEQQARCRRKTATTTTSRPPLSTSSTSSASRRPRWCSLSASSSPCSSSASSLPRPSASGRGGFRPVPTPSCPTAAVGGSWEAEPSRPRRWAASGSPRRSGAGRARRPPSPRPPTPTSSSLARLIFVSCVRTSNY